MAVGDSGFSAAVVPAPKHAVQEGVVTVCGPVPRVGRDDAPDAVQRLDHAGSSAGSGSVTAVSSRRDGRLMVCHPACSTSSGTSGCAASCCSWSLRSSPSWPRRTPGQGGHSRRAAGGLRGVPGPDPGAGESQPAALLVGAAASLASILLSHNGIGEAPVLLCTVYTFTALPGAAGASPCG